MRIAILGEGTRGDIWPLIALGAQMTLRGHEVTVAASEEFGAMAEAAGIRFVALPASRTAYLATEEGQRGLHVGGITEMRGTRNFLRLHRKGIADALVDAGEGADALVTGHNVQDLAQCLAIVRGIPQAVVHLFPIMPTGEFATVIATRQIPTSALRRTSHHLTFHLWRRLNRDANREFAGRLGLSRPPRSSLHLCSDPGTLVLQAFSPNLLPKPRDWGDNLAVTGFWQLPTVVRSSLDEGLPDDLAAWVDAGEPPVFLGLGSMPMLDYDGFLAMVMKVTRSLGVRAVVNMPASDRDASAADLPEHLRIVGAVDHERLLRTCSAAVHHGGAGTLAASLRAGLPTMVCSVWADQPFWGKRVEALGAGAHVPFKRLDRSRLEAGIRKLLSDPVRERAAALGEAIRSEGDGTERAAELLDEWLGTAKPLLTRQDGSLA
jgi:sterol 3beta-glucosyltransferase